MEITTIFGLLFGFIAIETLLLIFIMIKTPAITFMAASFFKRPLMYIIGKDRVGKFTTFTSQNGSAMVGKDGLYSLTENSHTLEAGSKTPIYFAFRDFAATLLPEYPAILQELRDQGVKLNKVEDITEYISRIKQGLESDLPVHVKPYKTYSFHQLEGMFPFNLDPTFIDATVQYKVSRGLKVTQAMPMVVGGVIMFMLSAVVAVMIVQKAFKGTMSPQDCQTMVAAAKCVGPQIIQAINSTPILP